MFSEKIAGLKLVEKQNYKYVVNIQALHGELWKKIQGL